MVLLKLSDEKMKLKDFMDEYLCIFLTEITKVIILAKKILDK